MKALNPAKGQFMNDLITLLDLKDTRQKYRALTAAGLAIGTGDNKKVKVVNTVTYLFNGVFKSKTTAEVAFTATTHDIAANANVGQEAQYFICVDGSGTLSIVMGAIANSGASLMPEIPANLTVIGVVKILVAAGSTKFTANSDALNAGHLTVTYTDLGMVSERFDAAQ